jgi:hypothetical protein
MEKEEMREATTENEVAEKEAVAKGVVAKEVVAKEAEEIEAVAKEVMEREAVVAVNKDMMVKKKEKVETNNKKVTHKRETPLIMTLGKNMRIQILMMIIEMPQEVAEEGVKEVEKEMKDLENLIIKKLIRTILLKLQIWIKLVGTTLLNVMKMVIAIREVDTVVASEAEEEATVKEVAEEVMEKEAVDLEVIAGLVEEVLTTRRPELLKKPDYD